MELPEMMPFDGPADANIRFGAVPERLGENAFRGARYEAIEGQYLLKVPGVGTYWVKDAHNVIIAPEPGASEDDIRVFILSAIMGVLAHSHGFLPLHASAVEIDGECVLFAGDSGAGKSTLAAAFHERGHRLVADDLCAISLGPDDRPCVHPGYRHLKLWSDALEHVGSAWPERRRTRVGLEKFNVFVPANIPAQPLRIRCMFRLMTEIADGIGLRPLRGHAKLAAIRQETFRLRLLRMVGRRDEHFDICNALARSIQVIEVRRPLFLTDLPRQVRRLEQELSAVASST